MATQNRSFSNRVRTSSQEQLDNQRNEYLNLSNAEPNLGSPEDISDPLNQPNPTLDHFLVSREDGVRVWTQRPAGIKIDGSISDIINRYNTVSGAVPAIGDLELGELEINTFDGKIFIKTIVDGIESIEEIQSGVQGSQGPQGTKGIQGERQTAIPVSIVGAVDDVNGTYNGGVGGPNDPQGLLNFEFPTPSLGDGVFDIATTNLWVWVGSEWLNVGLLRGPDGPQGAQGPQGPKGPIGIQGFDGPQGIIGPRGEQGIQGFRGNQGTQGLIGRSLRILGSVQSTSEIPGYPNAAAAGVEEGDAYIVRDDGNIYIWNGVTWFNGGRILIQGTQGTQGFLGPQGSQGIQGYPLDIIQTYSNLPLPISDPNFLATEFPDANPFSGVVDTTTGQGVLWQKKENGIWSQIGIISVQGPQGTQGPIGPQSTQGIQGPLGTQGPQGIAFRVQDTYDDPTGLAPLNSLLLSTLYPDAEYLDAIIDVSTGDGVLWVNTLDAGLNPVWEQIGEISKKGDDFRLYIDANPPTFPVPKIGDAWLDTTTGIKYTLIDDGDSTQWVELPSATQGPQGPQGAQGFRGWPLDIVDDYADPLVPLDTAYLEANYPSANPYSGVIDISSGDGILWQKNLNGSWFERGVISVQGLQGLQGWPLDVIDSYNDPGTPLNASYLSTNYPDANPYSGVVDISSGNSVLWQVDDGGTWSNRGIFTTQGTQGPQGVQGTALNILGDYNNPSVPLTSAVLESLYPSANSYSGIIDISDTTDPGDGVLWLKNESGTWDKIGFISLQGVQGIQGERGLAGGVGINSTDLAPVDAEQYVLFSDVNSSPLEANINTSGAFTFNTGTQTLNVGGEIKENSYSIVSQVDVGTDPNQVPLNGFLGSMAFADYPFKQTSESTIGDSALIQINAPTTDLYSHIADFTIATADIEINKLTSGYEMKLYLKNTSASQAITLTISASETNTGHSPIDLAGGGVNDGEVELISGGTGVAVVWVANVAGNIVGGVVA